MPEHICDPTDAHIFAGILQIVVVGAGALWFWFLKRGLENSRHLHYMAIGWVFMGLMYAVRVMFCAYASVITTSGAVVSSEALGVSSVMDSTLSILSSAALLMSWYLLRDFRHGVENLAEDSNPTMSKTFIAKLSATIAAAISGYVMFVKVLVENNYLQHIYLAIDVLAAAMAGFFLGWEMWKAKYIEEKNNTQVFAPRAFQRMRRFGLIAFWIWGASQLLHPLSLPMFELKHFAYPTGVFYDFLSVMKIICAMVAGIIALHIFPEKPQFRHKTVRRRTRATS